MAVSDINNGEFLDDPNADSTFECFNQVKQVFAEFTPNGGYSGTSQDLSNQITASANGVLQFATLAEATNYYTENTPEDYTRFDVRDDDTNNGEYVFLDSEPNDYRLERRFSSVDTFDNINELLNIEKVTQNVVYVSGYYEPNDGGGGIFIYSASNTEDEFDGIVLNPSNVGVGRFKRVINNGLLDVRYTGCKCDNTGVSYNGTATDDRVQFLKSAQYAIDNNLTLFAPSDLNIYLSGDIDLTGLRNADLRCRIVGDENAEIILGTSSTSALSSNYHIEEVRDIGIKFQGLKNSRITVRYANDITLYADADIDDINSMAYNSFYFGFLRNLLITNNENSVDTSNGWINENKFFLNRIFTITMSGSYAHNHNIFYGGSIEGANSFIDIQSGNGNHFYDLRLEGDASITFSENTRSNYIEKSYSDNDRVFVTKDFVTDVTDLGVQNMVCTQSDKLLNETVLTELNAFSENYDLDDLERNGDQLQIKGGFDEVYKSEIIPLTQDLGFIFNSDLAAFRMRVYCYDENKNTITVEPNNVNSGALSWDIANSRYGSTTNQKEYKAAIFKDDVVKYVQLEVSTGGGENSSLFDSAIATLVHQYPIKVPSNSPSRLESLNTPTSTGYPPDTKVYKTPLTAGGVEGWVYVGETWKTFGAIQA